MQEAARVEEQIKQTETDRSAFAEKFTAAAKLLAKAPNIFKVSSYPQKADMLKTVCLKPFLDEGIPLFAVASPLYFFAQNRAVLGGARLYDIALNHEIAYSEFMQFQPYNFSFFS
ncbi:MAG: hypothetical protein ABW189_05650 [Rickettsiales bacterium]